MPQVISPKSKRIHQAYEQLRQKLAEIRNQTHYLVSRAVREVDEKCAEKIRAQIKNWPK